MGSSAWHRKQAYKWECHNVTSPLFVIAVAAASVAAAGVVAVASWDVENSHQEITGI